MKKLLWGAVEDAAQRAKQNWEANQPLAAPSLAPQQEKQYLRLPMESARKLRWYDKGDTAAIVKTHLREKREMAETLGALKKIIIRSGLTEAEIDAEVVAMLKDTELALESDEGVNSVLLVAVQAELESLQALTARMTEERVAMQERLSRAEAAGAATKGRDAWNANFSLDDADADAAGGRGGGAGGQTTQAVDLTLVADLHRCVQSLESALAASAASARHTRAVEAELSAAEVTAALQAAMASGASAACAQGATPNDVEDESGCGPSAAMAALLAKLQRLEGERRSACEERLELERQLAAALTMAEQAGGLKEAVAQASEQQEALEEALQAAQAEASAARGASRAAEEAMEAMRGELKRLQHAAQGAGAIGRLQDLCLQAEERAHSAERRASVADARCARAESGLRDASAALKEREKALAGAQAEVKALQAKLAAADSQGGGASVAGGVALASHQEEVSKLEKQVCCFEAEARAAQRELAGAKAAVAGAEGRMQAAEAREAQALAELRVMDEVTAERDQLAAQVFALRERLNEMKSEKGGAEYYKQLAHELQEGRARVEDELLVTGQLVTQLEGRLRATADRVDAAETAAQVAEARARDAEKQIGTEVEQRLAAVCANRTLWPPAILSEVAKLEVRLETLQGALSSAQAQMECDARTLEVETRQRTELQAHTAQLEGVLLRLEEAATERAQDAQQVLARLSAQLADARAEVAHLTAVNEELAAALEEDKQQRASRAHSVLLPPSPHLASSAQLGPQAAAVGSGKWQVQNVVGGGSLYGLSDAQQAVLGRTCSYRGVGDGEESEASEGASGSLQGSQHHSQADLQQVQGEGALQAHTSGSHSAHADASPQGGGGGGSEGGHMVRGTAGRQQQHQQQQQQQHVMRRVSSSVGSASGSRSGAKKGHPPQQVLGGVDILYLKNVVLKFMEAVTAGRIAERDALLPAVATLLQATPAEFHTLQRVLQNTAPPSVQVLSALGIKLPGF